MNNINVDIGAIFEDVFQKLAYNDISQCLVGELPLYIQPFPVEHQTKAEELIKSLAKRLVRKGKKVLSINLYDLCIDILQNEGILESILEDEASIPADDILATLDSVLDVKGAIIPRIEELISESNPNFVLISGVGNVYPFLRSHAILNNLEELATNNNLVLFFPGEYNSLQLSLFGRISDENYYRGMNLADIQIIEHRI